MEVFLTNISENADFADKLRNHITDMAIEAWKFSKVFERMMDKLDAGEQSRYINQLRWFLKKNEESLHGAGLRIVNIEGSLFDPGIAATAINLGDFEPEESLSVDQMLEPIVMEQDKIFRTGTVILRRADK